MRNSSNIDRDARMYLILITFLISMCVIGAMGTKKVHDHNDYMKAQAELMQKHAESRGYTEGTGYIEIKR